MGEEKSYLRVVNLGKVFRKDYALKNINFEIKEKGLFLFLGENGSGKTTLFKILSFLLFPSKGDFFYFDEKTNGKEDKFLRNIGFASHIPFLYPDLTAYENLEFSAKFFNVNREKIKEFCERFECIPYIHKKVKELSRGQMQRISIIRAIMHDPFFIYLDEPFTSLDKKGIKILEEYIKENLNDKVIMVSSHTYSEIFEDKKGSFT